MQELRHIRPQIHEQHPELFRRHQAGQHQWMRRIEPQWNARHIVHASQMRQQREDFMPLHEHEQVGFCLRRPNLSLGQGPRDGGEGFVLAQQLPGDALAEEPLEDHALHGGAERVWVGPDIRIILQPGRTPGENDLPLHAAMNLGIEPIHHGIQVAPEARAEAVLELRRRQADIRV